MKRIGSGMFGEGISCSLLNLAAALALCASGCGSDSGAAIVPGEVSADNGQRADWAGEPRVQDDPATPETAGECVGDACAVDCGQCPDLTACTPEGVCGPYPCQSTKECPGTQVCAEVLGHCVDCLGDEDCGEGQACGPDRECHAVIPCSADKDCKDAGMVCDKDAGVCVDCLDSQDCAVEKFCDTGYCLPDVCTAGATACQEQAAVLCVEDGSALVLVEVCAAGTLCQDGICVQHACEPLTVWCEADTVQSCSEDGMAVLPGQDCAAADLTCVDGECLALVCEPNSMTCLDKDTVSVCAEDGLSSTPADCPAQHSCVAGSCQPWVCEPGKPACNGSVAGTCDAFGLGFQPGGVDCAAQDEGCVDGACVSCSPDCAGKECGSDGCGGTCGSCELVGSCDGGQCVTACGDGICASLAPAPETCATCADDCGACPVTDGFVKVPAGSFWMGSPAGNGEPCPVGYTGGGCKGDGTGFTVQEPFRDDFENLHYVKLTHDFEIQVHELTQGEWMAAFGWNPSKYYKCGGDCPVDFVSWFDACAYANWMSEQAGLTPCYVLDFPKCKDGSIPQMYSYKDCMNGTQKGIQVATPSLAGGLEKPYACDGYRLPTEAEWEYAVRAGSLTPYYPSEGNDGTIWPDGKLDPNLDQIAWYGGNSHINYSSGEYLACPEYNPEGGGCGPHPVGGKEANAWGLKDMLGNAGEWCSDPQWYPSSDYPVSTIEQPAIDPYGVGGHRVVRGCAWLGGQDSCRSAWRSYDSGAASYNRGFRLARTL